YRLILLYFSSGAGLAARVRPREAVRGAPEMDNTTYVGLSKQILLQRELDIVANNLANVDTTGFKVEGLTTATDTATPARTIGVNQPVQFAIDNGVARDFSQGALQQTGAPLDLAIQGQGF